MSNTKKVIETAIDATDNARPRRNVRWTRWLLPVFAAVGLVVSVITGVWSSNRLRDASNLPTEATWGSWAVGQTVPSVKSYEDPEREAARAREAARIREARQNVIEDYSRAIKTEFEAFRRRVHERSKVFDTVRSSVPGTVGKYGFPKCWSLTYALAKDKIFEKTGIGRGNNFEPLMNNDMRTCFYQPIQNARGEVIGLIGEFQLRLEACRQDMCVKMNRIPGWDVSLGEPPATLKAESLRIEETMASLIGAHIGASVSAAFDAACIPLVVRSVGRLLGKSAARLAAGGVAGLATSMADSPAPGPADLIGLLIFGGSAAMTAYDVYEASHAIPSALAKAMYETVDTQREEVCRRALDEGEKLFLSYSRAASETKGSVRL